MIAMTDKTGMHAGKTALVVGASRGIGAATARHLASEGADIVLTSRDRVALDGVAEDIRNAGGSAVVVVSDMHDLLSLDRAVQCAIETFGSLDIAVNNAGTRQPRYPFHELPAEAIDENIAINLRSVVAAMQSEVAAMLKSGGGSIVNVGSVASVRGAAELPAYAAAKHGLLGLTRSVALQYAASNIRVNMIAPGAIMTEMLMAGAAATAEGRAALQSAIPMRRVGQPEEIAGAISWICSNQASYITGAVIPADGGMSL